VCPLSIDTPQHEARRNLRLGGLQRWPSSEALTTTCNIKTEISRLPGRQVQLFVLRCEQKEIQQYGNSDRWIVL
jgi:hypothetical protein